MTVSAPPEPRRILVTGAGGAIGTPVCRHLQERGHRVRGFALEAHPDLEDSVVGNLSDFDAVRAAVAGMDSVIHLGAYPDEADFVDELLEPNVRGLYHVCAAAVNHYALTKVWAEEMGRMYARVHNLSVILVRIGWFPRNTGEALRLAAYPRGPSVYLSHTDAARFFERCVESAVPAPGEAVTLFAISRPAGERRLDMRASRETVGYEPQDTWPEGLPFPHE